jgi:hypothetical protein
VLVCGDLNDTPPGRHHPDSAWASRLPTGHWRVQPAGLGRRQPAVEPGPQDARRRPGDGQRRGELVADQ